MRSSFLILAAIVVAPFLTVTTANAEILFTLNNVGITFDVNGRGTYTPDVSILTSSHRLLTYNGTASASGPAYGSSFAYANMGSRGLLNGYSLDSGLGDSAANTPETQHPYFLPHPAPGGTTLPSYETAFLFGNSSGSTITVTAAPEPSAYLLALLATGLFAGLAFHRRSAAL